MLYYYIVLVVSIGAAYVWATKKYGRAASITSLRKAVHQNWALYRRRLLKRTRSQTPPAGDSADQVPLIKNDRLESSGPDSIHLELRSVTSDGELLPTNSGGGGGSASAAAIGGVRSPLCVSYYLRHLEFRKFVLGVPVNAPYV